MKILILQITLLLEIAKYMLGMQLGFKSKFRRWQFIPIGMLVYFVCISLNDFTIPEEYVLMYLTAYVLVILMNTARVWKRIVHFFFIFLIIAALDEFVTLGIRLLINNYSGIILLSYWENLYCSVTSFSIVSLVVFFKNVKKLKRSEKLINYFNKGMYFWIIILMIDVLLMTTILNYAKKYVENDTFRLYVTVLSILTYLGTTIVSLFLVLIRNSNVKLFEIVTAERELSKMQTSYYKMMLDREEDTRKYRHDSLNHMICIKSLLEKEEIKAETDYVDNMYERLVRIKNRGYDVGNEIINIFINNYLLDLDETVKIEISGKCKHEIDLGDIDMCIIFSNLIQNAVEEMNKCLPGYRLIKISFSSGIKFVKIMIANGIGSTDSSKGKVFRISKKFDRKNHGHGLINVTEVLNRNNSELEIEISENVFQVSFILKYKNDH